MFCKHKEIVWSLHDGQYCFVEDWWLGTCSKCGAQWEADNNMKNCRRIK